MINFDLNHWVGFNHFTVLFSKIHDAWNINFATGKLNYCSIINKKINNKKELNKSPSCDYSLLLSNILDEYVSFITVSNVLIKVVVAQYF